MNIVRLISMMVFIPIAIVLWIIQGILLIVDAILFCTPGIVAIPVILLVQAVIFGVQFCLPFGFWPFHSSAWPGLEGVETVMGYVN